MLSGGVGPCYFPQERHALPSQTPCGSGSSPEGPLQYVPPIVITTPHSLGFSHGRQ